MRAHIRKTSCYRNTKEKAMRRRFLIFLYLRKKLFSRSLSVDEDLINRHRDARYVLEPTWRSAGSRSRPRDGAACSRIMHCELLACAIAIDCHLRCTRLRRFAFDFFDSHFFALRFAVVSQWPEIDSQTAMRNRINYSLWGETRWKIAFFCPSERPDDIQKI